MGARGSSLVGKAVVDEKLMPYTAYRKQDILLMRERHLHDLGGRYKTKHTHEGLAELLVLKSHQRLEAGFWPLIWTKLWNIPTPR